MAEVNQKRIAVNTLLLYARMILVMLVGFFTSRIVLNALGETDFGVYDAVASIVGTVAFISNTMSTTSNRWYSYVMGQKRYDDLNRIFCLSFTIFVLLAVIVAILAETMGLWWLQNKADVAGRGAASKWVFHCSVVSFVLVIMRTPYRGMITAKEKMKVFAYLSVFESIATLGVALAIFYSGGDKLILYALLLVGVQFITTFLYWLYCHLFYSECKYHFTLDRKLFKEMFSFAGWNMIGACADTMKVSGLNLMLNSFFGPAVNAARGVANKAFNSVYQLNDNFFTAVRPQVVKSYAANELEDMRKLVCQSSKFSFFLLFVVSLPILVETPWILEIWLKGRYANVPEMSVVFTRLLLVDGLVNALTSPLAASMQATGRIRNYQIIIGSSLLLILPVSYIGLNYYGLPAMSVFVVCITVDLLVQGARVLFVRHNIGLKLRTYFKTVFLPIIIVTMISGSVSFLVHFYASHSVPGIILTIFVSLMATCVCVFLFGMTVTERCHTISAVSKFLKMKDK